MRIVKLLPPSLLAFAFACGGDNGAGPAGPNSNPATNLSGDWRYATANVSGSGISCSSSGTVLTITQQGNAFSGSYSGGTLTCTTGGPTQSVAVGTGAVVAGTVSGSTVSFDLDTSDWHDTGSVSGNSMSGSVTVRLAVDYQTFTLTGNWGASRQ
jgi:hypothetical protein